MPAFVRLHLLEFLRGLFWVPLYYIFTITNYILWGKLYTDIYYHCYVDDMQL